MDVWANLEYVNTCYNNDWREKEDNKNGVKVQSDNMILTSSNVLN